MGEYLVLCLGSGVSTDGYSIRIVAYTVFLFIYYFLCLVKLNISLSLIKLLKQLPGCLSSCLLFKHSHANSQKQMSSEWTKFSRAHHGTNTTIYITNRCAYRCTQPVAIRHSDMVVVQGKTEESCDRVSDNVQCLLLHSFSITRQYAHSTLAAANSFSLADLDLRAGLPISSLFCGFLE